MSVQKREGSPHYYYRFKVGGRTLFRSTGTANRREAEDVERQARQDAKAEAKALKGRENAPMTLDEAGGRYWTEVGQYHKRSDVTAKAIAWLIDELGGETLIKEIRDRDVARLVAKRRADRVVNVARDGKPSARRKGKLAPAKLVSPARVNRSVTEPLRKILLKARKAWDQEIREINWNEHILKEPRERVRALSDDEEGRLFSALPAQFHPIVDFCLRVGAREAEAVGLTWPRIDWTEQTMRLLGKGNKERTIPIPYDVAEMLRPLRQIRGNVFRYANGDPITVPGFVSAFKRACRASGVVDMRIHDLRHTAATRLLQDGANLRQAQRMLGHEDVKTTAKYTHVFDEDLRAAMNRSHAAREARRQQQESEASA